MLAFSALDGPTDYANGLVARTAFEGAALELKLPGEAGLVFSHGKPERAVLTGDFFDLMVPEGRVRGAFLDARHLLVEGPCEVRAGDRKIAAVRKGAKTLAGATSGFNPALIDAPILDAIRARGRWLESRSSLAGAGREPLCKALSIMKSQVCSPEAGIGHRWTTPDRWPHRAMWLWDSAFHAIGWRHVDPVIAREAIQSVLDVAGADGFVPHMASPEGRSGITQPPVLAMAAALVDETAPDPDWIRAVYPGLRAYVEWDLAHRDTDGAGLAEWSIEGDPFCRSGESGMDNSPRFDAAVRLDATDFNSFLVLECEALERFALALGRGDDAAFWRSRRERLARLVNERLWDEEAGFYVDYDIRAGRRSAVLACSGFMPLAAGIATAERAQRLADHLANPATFGTAFRVPSVAAANGVADDGDMWRGPVWINMNWLIVRGLRRYGMDEAADRLAAETVTEIGRQYAAYGTLFEFYDARKAVDPPLLKRKGRCDPAASPYHQVFHDYGWTATLYADLLLAKR